MMRTPGLSLRLKLGGLVVLLMLAVMGFVQLYFPDRIAHQARVWAERRAVGMSGVLASAVVPGLDFDQAVAVDDIFADLAHSPDVVYAVVRRPDGSVLSALRGNLAPPVGAQRGRELAAAGAEPVFEEADGALHVFAPVRVKLGAPGVLQVGFSLDQLVREQSRQRWMVGGVAVLLFLVGLALALMLGTLLVRPIVELTRVTANIVARGDLTQRIEVSSADEVGVLAASFREMVGKLRSIPESLGGTVGGVVKVVDHVSQTAREVSNGSSIVGERVEETSASMGEMLASLRGIAENVDALSRNAEASATSNTQMVAINDGVAKQVADMAEAAGETTRSVEQLTSWIRQISGAIEELNQSIETTSASMSEMDASIGEVESKANETTKLAAAAAESSAQGVNAIQQTIAGIDRIRESSSIVSRLIESLGARLSHIGDIVVVIDTVAGQTNLLALNAAIIASQAGEHGRGFAVVADEIKALATRTAASTQEIRKLIEGIQEESSKAVMAVEETARSIDEGVRLGGAAEQALTQISSSTGLATAMVKAIASTTVEQARASRQVTTSIHRIAESIQRINSAAREQAHSSELIGATVSNMQATTQSVLRSSEEQRKGASQIARSVENISHMVKSLAVAQREQTIGAEQVLRAIEAIKDVAIGQSAAAAQLEAALTGLQEHAGTLKTAVQQFRA